MERLTTKGVQLCAKAKIIVEFDPETGAATFVRKCPFTKSTFYIRFKEHKCWELTKIDKVGDNTMQACYDSAEQAISASVAGYFIDEPHHVDYLMKAINTPIQELTKRCAILEDLTENGQSKIMHREFHNSGCFFHNSYEPALEFLTSTYSFCELEIQKEFSTFMNLCLNSNLY